MCDALVWSFDVLTSIQWLELIKAVAPVATAIIAFLALRNWRRQDKAKREAEFLDSLIEATHDYVAEIPTPITLLEIARIGMASHASGESSDAAVFGAVTFIRQQGGDHAQRMLAALAATKSSMIKLRSLATKGQVFAFDDYANCMNAVAMLTWQYDRTEAFTALIGSSSLNWEHPEILRRLVDVMAIEPDEMRTCVRDNNIALIKFASDTYKLIYG
ncbi:hypothetical protein [Cupriavidus pampae]|uniref:Uncharacterized protein n=1 Tax=Cupriavidus pampae TaxID=659251 RepID=A0ABN7ZPA5_9BURK|nr:hypothetical protein [Cupriavidus pampae]CAG9186115.1 hypothetical protein LMG32289_06268 [Cupriavidus pampae]